MTPIDLSQLPAKFKLEVTKEDLEAFARVLLEQSLEPKPGSAVPTSGFMTINEAAIFTNLAKQTLYALASQRRVPHFKRAKRLLFRRSDLEQWLLESKRKTIQEMKTDLRKG